MRVLLTKWTYMKLWIVVSPVKPDSNNMLKVKLISEAIDGNNTQFVGLYCLEIKLFLQVRIPFFLKFKKSGHQWNFKQRVDLWRWACLLWIAILKYLKQTSLVLHFKNCFRQSLYIILSFMYVWESR